MRNMIRVMGVLYTPFHQHQQYLGRSVVLFENVFDCMFCIIAHLPPFIRVVMSLATLTHIHLNLKFNNEFIIGL